MPERNSFMRQNIPKSQVVTCSCVEQGKGVTMEKTICFDTETTGLQTATDEILSLSIIDDSGNVLFDSLIKPYFHDKWDDAQKIHGITPEDVKDAPYPHEIAKKVREILESADIIITYNGQFDIRFLERWNINIDLERVTHIDVMDYFSKIYREWNEIYKAYKWQKLAVCAEYYGYEFKAHNSLEDAKATLYCWQQMKKTDFRRRENNFVKDAAVEKE